MKQKTSAKSKSVVLFGGSFDPPHAGHYEMVRRVAKRKSIDQVWIIPVYRHAFAKKISSFAERITWCRDYFKPLGLKVKVKDTEKKLGGVSWSSRLVQYLVKKHPQYRFYWMMGEDAFQKRHEWREWDVIEASTKLIVFARGEGSVIPPVSSTEIRRVRGWKQKLAAERKRK